MAWNICFIKNIDTVPGTYCGMEIQPDAEYQIQDSERDHWNADSDVLFAITNQKLAVGNGSIYFSRISDQLACLLNSSIQISNLGPMDATGKRSIVVHKAAGSSTCICSHNFSDRCSWYQQSVRVLDEVLTLKSGNTFSSSHTYWIDLTHGRLYNEDTISGYHVTIKIDGVTQTSGFTIDYPAGEVNFASAPTGVVTATYSYENGSRYTLVPTPGKRLMIEHTEVQFSRNVQIPKPFIFEIKVYNPSDLPNKVVYNRIKYKNAKDFINAGNQGQGFIPAFGELTSDVICIPFSYITTQALKSSQGAELSVSVQDNEPVIGELGTVAFYVFGETE